MIDHRKESSATSLSDLMARSEQSGKRKQILASLKRRLYGFQARSPTVAQEYKEI